MEECPEREITGKTGVWVSLLKIRASEGVEVGKWHNLTFDLEETCITKLMSHPC